MGKIELPLWDKDEKDVLPAYQLSYGHVLVPLGAEPVNVTEMAQKLGFRRCGAGKFFEYKRLLVHPDGCRYLGDAECAQILVATTEAAQCIFAPHFLFLNNKWWIKWNRHRKGSVAVVARDNLYTSSYTVFRDGTRLCSAWTKGEMLEVLKDPVIQASFLGQVIYRSPPSSPVPTEDVIRFLKNDIEMEQLEDKILFRIRFGGAEISTDSVTQFDVFDWRG